MRRLLVIVVAVLTGWWAWQRWLRTDAAAGVGRGLAGVTHGGDPTPAPPAETAQPLPVASLSAPHEPERSALMASGCPEADAVRRREPEALARGYRRLLDAAGPTRGALTEALRAAAGDTAASAIEALGEGNAFLHSAEGRAAALHAIKLAGAQPSEKTVKLLTTFLERAMRGSIEKTDTEPQAVVNQAYAAMQPHLNRTIFNPEYTAGARSHQVARGESLDRIASAYRKQGLKLDAMTLGLFNRISDPSKLRQGQILKVPAEPVSTVVEKRSFLMAIYLGDIIFRLYWVGHGKEDRTPETTFTVGLKQERPDWYIDGRVIPFGHPENILGPYFVKFEHASFQGYGAHGTPEPETIGTMASRGCIRMLDPDIRDYFRIIPRGSPVHVRATINPGSR